MHGRKKLTTFAFLVLIANSCGGAVVQGSNSGPDPTSTLELMVTGGASYQNSTPEGIAEKAQALVKVRILDVKRSHLNTRDENFPSAEELGKYGTENLVALTDLDVEVLAILAVVDGIDIPSGGNMKVTLGGGYFDTTLTKAQAQLIGLTESQVVGGPREHLEGETGPPDVEIETLVDRDGVAFGWGSAPDVPLVEGDVVVLTLVEVEIPTFDGGSTTILTIAHPEGVFAENGGRWQEVVNPSVFVDLDAVQRAVGRRKG